MAPPKHIVVVGSSNTDMVARTPALPRPGQTVLGTSFAMAAGGKGANQAVAAARLGAKVVFVARLGADLFGDAAVEGFTREGIDTRYVLRDKDSPSGIALIGVDENTGENAIIVAPGANARLSPADVQAASDAISTASVLVCQLETPLETVNAALDIARAAEVPTILNPAPACALPAELLSLVSILTPNEDEAALLAGDAASTPLECARRLRALGAERVVVTLGAQGALVADNAGETSVPAPRVSNVVDTTAAGDCFNGALAVALAEGRPLEDAALFACRAAAISVTRAGAQPSLPYRGELG